MVSPVVELESKQDIQPFRFAGVTISSAKVRGRREAWREGKQNRGWVNCGGILLSPVGRLHEAQIIPLIELLERTLAACGEFRICGFFYQCVGRAVVSTRGVQSARVMK